MLHGSDFGSVEHRILADCPLVRSLGELVESGKPFVWMPGQMPFFVQSCRDVIVSVKGPVVRAHRVDDYVPVFQETIQVASPKDLAFPSKAVAVEPASAPSVPDVVEHADDSSDVRGEEVAPGGEGASDADSESGEEPFTRIQRLQKEASSLEHQMRHIPKNRYCDTCQRARMYRRKITNKRADPLADRGELEPVTEFGQRVAADFIIVSKTLKDEKETVVLVLRDEFSGFIAAYPAPTRSQDSIVKSVLSFLGPTYFARPMIMCKTDNAPEFKAACSTLGFVHEPTLSRRFPHNSVLEREIRTLEEITRAAHLGAGFQVITGLWQHSVQYAATATNAFHPVKDVEGATHNRHMRAAGKLFDGRKLILGQLIYVRRDPLNRHKFEANAAPALFAGWRYDSGPKSHKGVYYALDYAALKSGAAGGTIALSVPCEEVYVPPGAPIMPLKVAAESALADFAEPNAMMYLPKEVPFSNLPTDAPPVVRHEYITLDRIIRFGPTPDCSACSKTSGRHNNRCKIRFDRLVKAEKASKIEKVPVGGSLEALPGTPDPGVPETPVDVAKPTVMLESSLVEDDAGEDPAALPFSAGIPPGAEEAESGKGLLLRPNLEADREFLESNRERRLYRRSNMLPGEHTLFEYACAPDSVLSQACEDVGVEGIQLAHDVLDFEDEQQVLNLTLQAECRAGADVWVSLPCKKLRVRRREARMFGLSVEFVTQALSSGGRVAYECLANSGWWDMPEVKAFEALHCFRRVYFHGCMLGVRGKHLPIKQLGCISTNDERIIHAFAKCRCDNSHEHEPAEGRQTTQLGHCTRQLADAVLEAWYPMKFHRHVPDVSVAHGLVTRNLKRSEWFHDPKGVEAVRKEGEGLRKNGTWLDETVIPVAELKRVARARGEPVKVAEVLTLCGIKHFEMSEEHHKYKGRIVYRGDQIRNEENQLVLFEETATTPTALAALNLALWFGCSTCVSCADCVQAFLQSPLDDQTWVILPTELWLSEWHKRFDKSTKNCSETGKVVVWPSPCGEVVARVSRERDTGFRRNAARCVPKQLPLPMGGGGLDLERLCGRLDTCGRQQQRACFVLGSI